MPTLDLIARALLVGAALVLLLHGYVALDAITTADELAGHESTLAAGILVALAGALFALDRRTRSQV
jgi:hypothetical protein